MMNNQQLIQAQRAIEQFFHKIRVNIALHDILRSSVYTDFEKEMRLAIENQILFFAQVEKINQVIGAQKIDADLLKKIFLLFPFLSEFIDQKTFEDYLVVVSGRGIESATNMVGVDKTFSIDNLDKMVSDRTKESMKNIDDTTIDWIANRINNGVKNGDSSYEIAKTLRDTAREQAQMRAETIAEQEAAWALGEIQINIYQQAGIQKKKLITSRDERVCVICMADEEAGEIALKDEFPSGSMGTPIHIRCRCFVLPVTANQPIEIGE